MKYIVKLLNKVLSKCNKANDLEELVHFVCDLIEKEANKK